ncbi:MAG: hypothetical protein ACKOYG_07670 [Ilumatobacteraceae bacterium]
MRFRRVTSALAATAVAVAAMGAAPAAATVTISNPSVSCSLTAVLPALSRTNQLTGSARVSCTAATSVNVTVVVQVVELDGAVVDQLGNQFIVSQTRSLTRSTKAVSWTVTTPARLCPSADGTGLEDFYTVAVISAGGSSRSETIGKVDGWNC